MATTVSDAMTALSAEFVSNFDDTIPVQFDNQGSFKLCTSPNLTTTTKPSNSIWVRFYFTNNDGFQVSFASEDNRTVRRPGLINYQVHIPQGQGDRDGRVVCEEINTIFELKRFSNIYCYTASYRESGIQEDGSYMLVGNIPFDFDVRI